MNRDKALSGFPALSLLSCFESVSQITWRKTWKIYEELAARMRKLITARVRKNKRTARMLANARKDHSIPLVVAAVTQVRILVPAYLFYTLFIPIFPKY